MESKLSNSILFSELEAKDLEYVDRIGHSYKIGKDSLVFLQDDIANRFYIVVAGKVKIFKTSPEGKEQILLMAGPGDSFGEAALFIGKNYPASAQAVEPTELISFARQDFMTLLQKHPPLAVNMIARLSMLLHHLTRLIQQISLEDVETRLAGYLLGLSPIEVTAHKEVLLLKEKKMILASLLGTIPETLSRAFAKLSQRGLISVDGQKIVVHNRANLEAMGAGQKD